MKCPKCQFDNPEGAKFCNECGNKLEMPCPKCGKVNPLGSKFCNECGQKLEKEEAIERKEPTIEGERKQVTVLLSDLSGYTAMSERLDPEEVKEIMLIAKGQMSQGLKLLEKGQRDCVENQVRTEYARSEYVLGKVYSQIAEGSALKARWGMAYLDLGLLYRIKGKTGEAKKCISEAIQIFEQTEAEGFLKQAKEALASL